MRVLLRCDATPAIGIGHLVRCLALAEAARLRGWEVSIMGRIDTPFGRDLLRAAALTATAPHDTPAALAEAALQIGANLVHVDHYGLGSDLRQPLEASGVMLSSMEEGVFGRRIADVVVDSTLGAEATGRPDDHSPCRLFGVRYAPLRTTVLTARSAAGRGQVPPPRFGARVLVVMGGTDATGAAAAVTALCARVATQGSYSRIAECLVLAPRERWDDIHVAAGRMRVRVAEPRSDMLELTVGFDLVISAAGTTVWELACIGAPMALVFVTENQSAGYRAALEAGIAVGLGSIGDVRAQGSVSTRALEDVLEDPALRDRMSLAGRQLIDGRGAERIVATWESLVNHSPAVFARPANVDDTHRLFEWRNDPVTRSWSRTAAPLEFVAHQAWLRRSLQDPTRTLLVVEHNGTPIATSSFDRRQGDLWEVSLTVAPDARGQGLGGPALAEAERSWRRTAPADAALLAHIRPGNTASRRLFERAGYEFDRARTTPELDAFVKPASTGFRRGPS